MSSDGRFGTGVPSKGTYIVIYDLLLKRSYFILVLRPSPSKQSGSSQREDQCTAGALSLQPKRRKIDTEEVDMPDHFDKGLESCFLGMYMYLILTCMYNVHIDTYIVYESMTTNPNISTVNFVWVVICGVNINMYTIVMSHSHTHPL